jgi:death-on-curing protein
MKILTKEQILLLHSQLIENFGGSPEIRDDALLDSAISTPFQTYDGKELYPTLLDKASRLCFGLVKNHPFVDGNKRIGTHAMLVFLAINGIDLEYGDSELIDLILSVASGERSDSDILKWLQQHIV